MKALGNYVSNLAHTYSFIIFAKIVHIWQKTHIPLFKNPPKMDSGNVHVAQNMKFILECQVI